MNDEYGRIIRFISRALTAYLVLLGISIIFVFASGYTIAGILEIVSAVMVGKFGFMLMNHYEDGLIHILTNGKKIAEQKERITVLKERIARTKAERMSKHTAADATRITELQTRIAYLENNIRLAKQRIGTSLET